MPFGLKHQDDFFIFILLSQVMEALCIGQIQTRLWVAIVFKIFSRTLLL